MPLPLTNFSPAPSPPANFVQAANLTEDQIEYLCGMSAAVCSVLVTFPINKIMFRQSLWGFDFLDAIRQLRVEGFQSLFRGCLPPVLIKSINSSVMFGTYHQYTKWLLENPVMGPKLKDHELRTAFVAGMLSGSTEALLTPFERVQNILQDGRLNNQYRNTVDAMIRLRRYGIAEYYRGMTAILMRNGPATFMYFGFKDRLKEFLLPANSGLLGYWNSMHNKEALRNFVSGAILGSTISTIFYPLNAIRIRMMIEDVGSPHLSVWRAAVNLHEERAGQLRLMFSGINANLMRSFLYWGCITVFSELLRDSFRLPQ